MNIDVPIWIYEVERLDSTKRSYLAAGPDNSLLFPLFTPSTEHEQLYVTKRTEQDPLFGEHVDQPFEMYDQITLSPFARGEPTEMNEFNRSIYEHFSYGRRVVDHAVLDATAWLGAWKEQPRNRPAAKQILERTQAYIDNDQASDELILQAHKQLREHVWSPRSIQNNIEDLFEQLPGELQTDTDTLQVPSHAIKQELHGDNKDYQAKHALQGLGAYLT